ncbi:MAG: alpha/beta hydrolase [Acidobacteria bacterium]|nr:alpha/beta hydrolase [Acidobacteriota bacterium]
MKQLLMIAALTTSAFAHAASPAMKEAVYTKGVSGDLVASIYTPSDIAGESSARGKKLSAVIYFHGGGWSHGTRAQGLAKSIAAMGYVSMSPEYDLVPNAHYPTQLDQAWAAVKYLQEHAAEYNVDASRIAVGGGSAGGELAALIGLRVRMPTGVKPVKAVVLASAVLDLTEAQNLNKTINNYMGGGCLDLIAACKEASPALASLKDAPPFFIGYGTKDQLVPPHQQTDFIAKLKAAHVPVEVYAGEGGPHNYASMPEWKEANAEAVRVFLNKYL